MTTDSPHGLQGICLQLRHEGHSLAVCSLCFSAVIAMARDYVPVIDNLIAILAAEFDGLDHPDTLRFVSALTDTLQKEKALLIRALDAESVECAFCVVFRVHHNIEKLMRRLRGDN